MIIVDYLATAYKKINTNCCLTFKHYSKENTVVYTLLNQQKQAFWNAFKNDNIANAYEHL